MQPLSVVRAVGDSRTVLSVRGELDIATVGILRAEVEDVLTDSTGQLVLDLSGTGFIDSTGSRELARTAKAAARRGVSVVAVVPRENRIVRKVLEFMRYGDLLPLLDEMPAQ